MAGATNEDLIYAETNKIHVSVETIFCPEFKFTALSQTDHIFVEFKNSQELPSQPKLALFSQNCKFRDIEDIDKDLHKQKYQSCILTSRKIILEM